MTQEAVRRMGRTKGLLSPKTSTVVGLTKPQKNAIQGVLDDTGKRLWKQMADNANENSTRRAQRCLAVLDEMDLRVEQTLTKAQRAAWAAVNPSYDVSPTTAAPTSTDPPADATPSGATPSDATPSDATPSDAVPPIPDPADQSPAA
jgi:phage terminase large subunit-like protein